MFGWHLRQHKSDGVDWSRIKGTRKDVMTAGPKLDGASSLAVSITGLLKSYGSLHAVDDVSFDVERG